MLAFQLTKPSDLTVRAMTLADIPTVQALAEKIWLAYYPQIISVEQVHYMLEKLYNRELLTARLQDPAHDFMVAEAGANMLGYAGYEQKAPGDYFIHRFYVDNDQHRCGVGSAMMRALKERLQPRVLQLHVNRKNISAQHFYAKHGFVNVAEKCTDIGQGFVMDDFVMRWEVAHGK